MKKLLLLLPLTFFSVPAQAITWDQFWRPFTYNRPYYPYYSQPYYSTPYIPMCDRPVYREEWIPPTAWSPGYMRWRTDIIKVPC